MSSSNLGLPNYGYVGLCRVPRLLKDPYLFLHFVYHCHESGLQSFCETFVVTYL